jgi:predicted Zn-dependent protease
MPKSFRNQFPIILLTLVAFLPALICLEISPALGAAGVADTSAPSLDELSRAASKGSLTDQQVLKLGKLVERDANNWRAHLVMAELYRSRGVMALSMQEYRRVLQLKPYQVEAVLTVATQCIEEKKLPEALRLVRQAKLHNKRDLSLWFMESGILGAMGKGKEVGATLRAAQRAMPDSVELRTLNTTQFMALQPGLCADEADKILATKPAYAPAYMMKAQCLMKLECPNEAVDSLHAAFQLLPYTETSCRYFADIFGRYGRRDDAFEAALAFVALTGSSSHEETKQARQAILQSAQAQPRRVVTAAIARIERKAKLEHNQLLATQLHKELAGPLAKLCARS